MLSTWQAEVNKNHNENQEEAQKSHLKNQEEVKKIHLADQVEVAMAHFRDQAEVKKAHINNQKGKSANLLLLCTNITTRGHIYEDFRDTTPTDSPPLDIAMSWPAREKEVYSRDCSGDGVTGDGGYGVITGDKIFTGEVTG